MAATIQSKAANRAPADQTPKIRRPKFRSVVVAVVVFGVIFLASQTFLTNYMESESFRLMIGRQTSRGLKLNGRYEPMKRHGFLTAVTSRFQGGEGEHTMKNLVAEDVEGDFNPLGFFRRRWQFDEIRIRRGSVELQKTRGRTIRPSWLTSLLWHSPGAFFNTLFRTIGDWFKGDWPRPPGWTADLPVRA